eukprot:scaffold186516_cov28-Tisochrysis_lutea.AAC.3
MPRGRSRQRGSDCIWHRIGGERSELGKDGGMLLKVRSKDLQGEEGHLNGRSAARMFFSYIRARVRSPPPSPLST